MTAPSWIDGPASLGAADKPAHAGLFLDLMRGDLLRTLQEGAIDLMVGHHKTNVLADQFVGHTFSSANEWQLVLEWPPLVIQARGDYGLLGPRELALSAEGLCTLDGVATVRLYLRDDWSPYLEPDPDEGLVDEAYAELSFSTGDWVLDSAELRPALSAPLRAHPIGDGVESHPGVILVVLAKSTVDGSQLQMRGVRVLEQVAVP